MILIDKDIANPMILIDKDIAQVLQDVFVKKDVNTSINTTNANNPMILIDKDIAQVLQNLFVKQSDNPQTGGPGSTSQQTGGPESTSQQTGGPGSTSQQTSIKPEETDSKQKATLVSKKYKGLNGEPYTLNKLVSQQENPLKKVDMGFLDIYLKSKGESLVEIPDEKKNPDTNTKKT